MYQVQLLTSSNNNFKGQNNSEITLRSDASCPQLENVQ